MNAHARRYFYTTTLGIGPDGDPSFTEMEVEFSYTVSWGAPETPPCYSHGGLPADPDEVDDIRIEKVDGEPRPFTAFASDRDAETILIEALTEADTAAMIEHAAEAEADFEYSARERQWEDRL